MLAALTLAAMVSLSKAERDAYFDKPPQNTLHDCDSEPPAIGDCRMPSGLTAQDITARLAGKDTAWWRDGDQFVVVAKRDTDQAYLCCAARGRMDHIDGDLWALRLHVADLNHATIDVSVRPGGGDTWDVYRGPDAPPALSSVNALHGRLIAHVFKSAYLDDPRAALIYVPPNADPAKKYPVVYLADGNARLNLPGMIEPLILRGELPPMILVMLWPGNSHKANEDRRSEEYLQGWPNGYGYFLAHESFLLKEVLPFVEQNFGASSDPKERVVSGFSSGAAWAISMGERHPDIFPNVIAQSLVWGADPGASGGSALDMRSTAMSSFTQVTGSSELVNRLSDSTAPRFFLSAGTLEPKFYEATSRFADAARAAGHDTKLETTVSGHTLTIWPPLLVDGLKWMLGKSK